MQLAPGERDPLPLWRRVLPFVIAIALIAFVFMRLDLRAFVHHLRQVNGPLFFGSTTVFLIALLAADSFATSLVYRRTVAPVRTRDFFILRGASYLPSMVNHHLGQAFITYFLSRVHKVALFRVAGATLLVYASWTGCLLGVACAAVVLSGKPSSWLLVPLGAGGAYLAVLALRPRRLVSTRLLAPLFEAGVRGHLIALFARLPHLLVLFTGSWLPFLLFDVRVPLSAALAYIPILMVATTLPITPQGIGTRDVLAATFFEQFAVAATREERLAMVAAATASWGIALTLIEAVFGLLFMRVAMRELRARGGEAGEAPEAPSTPPATPPPEPSAAPPATSVQGRV
jgi:hypothetical protein